MTIRIETVSGTVDVFGIKKSIRIPGVWKIGDRYYAPWKNLNDARMAAGEQTSHEPLVMKVNGRLTTIYVLEE